MKKPQNLIKLANLYKDAKEKANPKKNRMILNLKLFKMINSYKIYQLWKYHQIRLIKVAYKLNKFNLISTLNFNS